MILCTVGALVSWSGTGDEEVGVITELIQGGHRVRVRFEGGDEHIFVVDGGAIKRFYFQPGDHVQAVSSGTVGVNLGAKQVGQKIQYKLRSRTK
jgi:hypothetical protein